MRAVWESAARGFDQLFQRRRREHQARRWAEWYRKDQEEARARRAAEQARHAALKAQREAAYQAWREQQQAAYRAWLNERQAYADLPLIAAIRYAYKKRPARHAAVATLARVMVDRAIEWANYTTPLLT
jgi:hypothetical protein